MRERCGLGRRRLHCVHVFELAKLLSYSSFLNIVSVEVHAFLTLTVESGVVDIDSVEFHGLSLWKDIRTDFFSAQLMAS